MYGEIVKAALIINQNLYLGPVGPKARLLTTARDVWWVYPNNDGVLEITCIEQLSEEAYQMEINPR